MASYNRVILIGNLTRDPELRYIPSGTAVTEVGLAVNDRRKDASGQWIKETIFVDVTLWARTAEVASEYLSKGSPVLIEGRLKLDTWEKDGKKNSKLRVVGEKIEMLGSRGSGSGSGGGGGGSRGSDTGYNQSSDDAGSYDSQAAGAEAATGPDDDIPF
jgi:single-strand DNA-binding protein